MSLALQRRPPIRVRRSVKHRLARMLGFDSLPRFEEAAPRVKAKIIQARRLGNDGAAKFWSGAKAVLRRTLFWSCQDCGVALMPRSRRCSMHAVQARRRCALLLWCGPLALAALAAGLNPSGRVRLAWDYPTNELSTNLVFRLYTSTNSMLEATNWTVLTNVVGTNLSVDIRIVPGERFFFLTASNFWGESFLSNIASTPALPRADLKPTITRAD